MTTSNEYKRNELLQTTTNALTISTDSHQHIQKPQVTIVTEATILKLKQQQQ